MSALTSDFLANRNKWNRYKRFVLPASLVLLLAGVAVGGFYLFGADEKKASLDDANAAVLPASWVAKYFGVQDENDPRVGGRDADPDGDILTNQQEFYYGTDPTNADTDDDGQGDGAEVAVNLNPLGIGELYSTDIAKRIADQFVAANGLPEFKQENIEKQVLGILSPPKPEDIKIYAPDPKTLKVVKDDPDAIKKYINDMDDISGGVNYSQEFLEAILQDPSGNDFKLTLGHLYELIVKLREVSVPQDWVLYHQLHMAGLFAAANILEVSKTLDLAADIETQQTKYSEQYRQVAMIEEIEKGRLNEYVRLVEKYKDVIKENATQ